MDAQQTSSCEHKPKKRRDARICSRGAGSQGLGSAAARRSPWEKAHPTDEYIVLSMQYSLWVFKESQPQAAMCKSLYDVLRNACKKLQSRLSRHALQRFLCEADRYRTLIRDRASMQL